MILSWYDYLLCIAGLRRWKEQHQRGTSTSADTYFQLEKQSDPLSGAQPFFGVTHTLLLSIPYGYISVQQLSAIMYFFSGESLSFGECCRIKHLSTQKYLTLMKNHTAMLRGSVPNDGNDVFRLLPIDRINLSKVQWLYYLMYFIYSYDLTCYDIAY